jgi:hypothetical protein
MGDKMQKMKHSKDGDSQKKSRTIRLQILLLGAVLLGAIYFGVIANGSLAPGSTLPDDHNAAGSLATRTPFGIVETLTPTQTLTPEPSPTPIGPPVSLDDYERLFPGVFYKRQTSSSPRPYVAHIVVVDLNKRNIDLMVTPEDGLGQTTSRFLESYGLQLAINGDGWVDDSEDPIGFAASEGEVYSEDSQEPTIFISKNGIVKIGGNPPEKKIWYAISGSHTLVRNGQLDEKIRTCALREVYCLNLAPRTSIGLSAGNYLIIVLVEGPSAEPREALTLEELALLHLELGSVDAIAMDGGGSTTLVVNNGGGPQILNNPTDGSERVVANHLGIFVRNRANSDD